TGEHVSASSSPRVLAILGYHKVGPPAPGGWDTWFNIPQATFEAQLSCLGAGGWRVIDVPAFLRGLADPESLPPRAALITFDDGYRSLLDVTAPCLRRFGYPAVVFVPTDYIGGTNRFDEGNEPTEAICDWNDLRALDRAGISVQSHGASHRAFSALDAAAREAEVVGSRLVLESGLGRPVEVFAFPFGDGGPDASEVGGALRRAGYRAACLYKGGAVTLPAGDPFRLTRFAMGPDTDLGAELTAACGFARPAKPQAAVGTDL
ncbi:MAG TPA: polysaccharide deacetylase family protein, partial [Gemmataceae bacterium]|nr:polysaccharide deacetylase family protein [Gemmataceae bacterium]